VARPLRIEYADALYHVCPRGNARQQIFVSDKDRLRFIELLEQSSRRFKGIVLCFVLMGNHYHLIVQTRCPNLSRWMHWLGVSYTVFFNRRHRRSGHLFQGRYKSFLVEDGEYLHVLSRYVHLNPLRGAVLGVGTPGERRTRLRNYPWSSYPAYAGLNKRFGFVDKEMVLGQLGGPINTRQARYRRYTEEGLLRDIENPFEAVKWQAMLGSENFIRRMRDRLRAVSSNGGEIASLGKIMQTHQPDEVLYLLAKRFDLTTADLLSPEHWGLVARTLAMWMLWEKCGLTLQQIGDIFGGIDYAAVGQRIRRARASYSKEAAKQLMNEMLNVKT